MREEVCDEVDMIYFCGNFWCERENIWYFARESPVQFKDCAILNRLISIFRDLPKMLEGTKKQIFSELGLSIDFKEQ